VTKNKEKTARKLKKLKGVYFDISNFWMIVVYVKTSKKITKFKLRGKKYLYTLKTAD
jgi:hypothetical protein